MYYRSKELKKLFLEIVLLLQLFETFQWFKHIFIKSLFFSILKNCRALLQLKEENWRKKIEIILVISELITRNYVKIIVL